MHLEKRGFVIFLQWPTFWDFNDTRLLNYIPSGIRICFLVSWRVFFNLVLAPSSSALLAVKNAIISKLANFFAPLESFLYGFGSSVSS